MRGAAVVAGMPPPTVVRRGAAVGAGVGVASVTLVGWSGAAVFRRCVAAKAEMPVKLESVTSVARPRSATDELTSGRDLLGCPVRPGMRPSASGAAGARMKGV